MQYRLTTEVPGFAEAREEIAKNATLAKRVKRAAKRSFRVLQRTASLLARQRRNSRKA